MKKFGLLLLSVCLLLGVACSAEGTASNSETVKVGVVGTNEEEIWKHVKEELAAKDIDIEIVVFTDYNQPNSALLAGDVDLNAFQHYSFLDSFNEANESDLTVIGESYISPLGLYSKAVSDVSEIKEGDTIIIPNDPTNLGRALSLLQSAGLITVDTSVDIPTVENILENPLSLTIEALDASQTARSLEDATASIINGGMAVDAGLIPTEDAIYLEELSATSKPYINVIVSRADETDREIFKTILETFTTSDNAQVIKEVTKGACIPIWEL